MRILVCIKQIIDPEIPTRDFKVDRAAKKALQGEAALVVNPYDENALEAALQVKDRRKDSLITAMTLGGEGSDRALRRALSMGCDEAVWLKDPLFEGLDSFGTAGVLARAIRKAGPVDIVLCGRQAGDWDMGQVGPFVAEELSWPCVTMVFKVDPQDGKLTLKREAERGVETLEIKTPFLASVTSGSSNQPRYPTARGILTATRKKILVWSAPDLQISEKPPRLIAVEDLTIPSFERQTTIIDGENGAEKASKLVQHLAGMKII